MYDQGVKKYHNGNFYNKLVQKHYILFAKAMSAPKDAKHFPIKGKAMVNNEAFSTYIESH